MDTALYKRKMAKELRAAAKSNPVVTVTGPRQTGKTTLVRSVFPQKPYANLESLKTRELADTDPIGFLDRFPDGVILDEIQRCPHLLSEIQVRADASDQKGLYILTGSYQVGLRDAIAQSLAGRTAILHLLPMSMEELQNEGLSFSLDQILYQGCFPRIYKDQQNPTKAYSNYVQTYLERDLRQMIEVKNLQLFQKFLKLCAGRVGQLFKRESLANEVGISAKTIDHWISILEASYLVFLLPPFFREFWKENNQITQALLLRCRSSVFLTGHRDTDTNGTRPSEGQSSRKSYHLGAYQVSLESRFRTSTLFLSRFESK